MAGPRSASCATMWSPCWPPATERGFRRRGERRERPPAVISRLILKFTVHFADTAEKRAVAPRSRAFPWHYARDLPTYLRQSLRNKHVMTALSARNYWTDARCAKAFWGQHELPAYRRLLADTL